MREPAESLGQQPRAFPHPLRAHVVTQVDDGRARGVPGDDALQDAGVLGGSKIRQEDDGRGHG